LGKQKTKWLFLPMPDITTTIWQLCKKSGNDEYCSADPNFIGNKAIAGPGNLQPTIGTGNIIYAQAGLLLPSQAEKPKIRDTAFCGVHSQKL
jgi:hypothetical protein